VKFFFEARILKDLLQSSLRTVPPLFDAKAGGNAVSFEELAYPNMLVVQALVELLAEKGVLSQQEVLGRVERLPRERGAKRSH
jgi:hypothetical protein